MSRQVNSRVQDRLLLNSVAELKQKRAYMAALLDSFLRTQKLIHNPRTQANADKKTRKLK